MFLLLTQVLSGLSGRAEGQKCEFHCFVLLIYFSLSYLNNLSVSLSFCLTLLVSVSISHSLFFSLSLPRFSPVSLQVFTCPVCVSVFCVECDVFIHDTLHCCPCCIQKQGVSWGRSLKHTHTHTELRETSSASAGSYQESMSELRLSMKKLIQDCVCVCVSECRVCISYIWFLHEPQMVVKCV